MATQKLAYEAIQNQLTEESRKNERLLTERDSAENRARTLGNEMTDARRRISDRDEKYGNLPVALNDSNTCSGYTSQLLDSRFIDDSISPHLLLKTFANRFFNICLTSSQLLSRLLEIHARS